MKHIEIYENYEQKTFIGSTTLDQFKNLRRGDKIKYLGTSYTVEEPGDFLISARSEDDGEIIEINYNMFKSKGFIN
jgi:hypothetical protein